MKLIIDIPEKTANEIKDNAMFAGTIPSEILWDVTSAIVNGTPIPDNATVCDIEQIRAEITEELEDSIRWGGDQLYNAALKKTLEIIDKYTKGAEK